MSDRVKWGWFEVPVKVERINAYCLLNKDTHICVIKYNNFLYVNLSSSTDQYIWLLLSNLYTTIEKVFDTDPKDSLD